MDLLTLTNQENEIYLEVLSVQGASMKEMHRQLADKGTFARYEQVHLAYANLADQDAEALKRGVFIQWIALTEPSVFTGIAELDHEAKVKIIKALDDRIGSNTLDYELSWMLRYYADWDFVFERFKEFRFLHDWIAHEKGALLPDKIDTQAMAPRGRMGRYWNSLIRFAE
jgi:hypothetical protein